MANTCKDRRVRESCFAVEPSKVDRENGIIRHVKILGHLSKNGYRYSPAAIGQASAMYEGLGCYINHQADDEAGRERDFRDLFGHFENVTHTDTDAYGDLHYLKSHSEAEKVCEAAERMPRNFGLSHEAYWGERSEVGNELVIESITRVSSVDLVSSPATNNGLFESHRPKEKTVEKTSIRKLLEAAGAKGLKILKRLKEDDSGMGISDPAMMDAPMPMPEAESPAEELSPEDMMDSARDAQILSIIHDDSKDTPAKLAAIEAILNAHGDIQTAVAGDAPAPTADTTAMESARQKGADSRLKLLETEFQKLKTDQAKLLADNAKLKADATAKEAAAVAQDNARKLLEAEDVEATEERIEAVVLVTDEGKRKRLVEAFPKRDMPILGQRPETSRSIRESHRDVGGYEDARKEFEAGLPVLK